MTIKLKHMAAASAGVFALMGAMPAFAAGTTAGSTITNSATLNFQVSGVAQTPINAGNNLIVDRKVLITVAESGTTTTSVVPGQTAAVTTFTVTNASNAVLDLKLTAANLVGGAAPHTGTDGFDVTGATMYVDTNANGVYNAGIDTAVTYLDEVAADTTKTVFIVANVPIAALNGQIAAVSLTAQAEQGGAAAAEGAVLTQTAGADTAAMDTVFADAAGTDDIARDGKHSARDDYTVTAAALTVAKLSRVISDPINGTTNPKMIPGATVEYCITVANGAGAATATNVVITDTIPATTTYVSAFGVFEGGTVAAGVCSGGTATGTFATGTATGNLGTIAASVSESMYFRVTIN